MKEKIKILLFILFTLLLPIFYAKAGSLTCWDVNGMSIFGYKYDEYVYIGSIANEFSSKSIANEFGWGNEFKSDSIMNDFGKFGSKFSSYSAFNEFASKPPIIVNRDNKFVGYLTINDFKTPSINTYIAIACAKDSFGSPIRNHEDIIFKDIPSKSSGDYGYSDSDIEELLKGFCQTNSQYSGGQCVCDAGYIASGNSCITYTQNCQLKYGLNSYGDKQYCYCSAGYEWDAPQTTCIKSVICPLNSTKINNVCVCNEGHIMRNNQCITYTEDCIQHFGQNVYGTKGNDDNSFCNCNEGYEWNISRTACMKTEIPERKEEIVKPAQAQQIQHQEEEKEKSVAMLEDETQEKIQEPEEQKQEEIKDNLTLLASIFNAIKNFFSKAFSWF